jgi:hypothetical protein
MTRTNGVSERCRGVLAVLSACPAGAEKDELNAIKEDTL